MDSNNLEIIRERYENLPSQNEETVKIQIIIPFLKLLGYQESWIIGESQVLSKRNRVDIAFYVNQEINDKLYIETKRADRELMDGDIEQLLNYLNIINVEWGILTNGKDYLLLNNKIDGNYKYKIVFNYNLKDMSKDYMLEFFTCESLFCSKITYYFKYLAQFKAYRNITNEKNMSWRQYYSTLFNFFMYLANKKHFYEIDKIRPNDFKEYLIITIKDKKKQNRRYAKSQKSIKNYYRFISGMYETFKSNGMKINNPFELITEKEMLSRIECDIDEKNNLPLENDEVVKILRAFDNSQEPERNKLIFLLVLYCALDKNEIQKLKISDIDIKHSKFIFEDREIPLSKYIMQLIKEYLEIRKKKEIDSDYLFCRKYNAAYDYIGDSSYCSLINTAVNKTDINNERKRDITLSTIKRSAIIKMLSNGFHIEEILYLTGLSLSALDKYLDDIELNIDTDKMISRHPYAKFF